ATVRIDRSARSRTSRARSRLVGGDGGYARIEPEKGVHQVGIGVSVFLLAVGAILAFAVHTTGAGANLSTIGIILMVAGGFGLLLALAVAATHRGGPT